MSLPGCHMRKLAPSVCQQRAGILGCQAANNRVYNPTKQGQQRHVHGTLQQGRRASVSQAAGSTVGEGSLQSDAVRHGTVQLSPAA